MVPVISQSLSRYGYIRRQ